MAGASIAITIDDTDVQRAFQALQAHMADMSGPLDEIGTAMVLSTEQRFEDGAGPDGTEWKPSLRALAQGGQTLVDHGHLRDSITHLVAADAVEIGTNMVYGAIHQFGGKAGRSRKVELPARPYLGLSDDDEDEIYAILEDWIREPLP